MVILIVTLMLLTVFAKEPLKKVESPEAASVVMREINS